MKIDEEEQVDGEMAKKRRGACIDPVEICSSRCRYSSRPRQVDAAGKVKVKKATSKCSRGGERRRLRRWESVRRGKLRLNRIVNNDGNDRRLFHSWTRPCIHPVSNISYHTGSYSAYYCSLSSSSPALRPFSSRRMFWSGHSSGYDIGVHRP